MPEINYDSNLVRHAKRELDLIGETDQWYVEGVLSIISTFAAMGNSGGSAGLVIDQITKLLRFEPLAPITDEPEDWYFHGAEVWYGENGVWQNKRDGRLFSTDGGKTWYSKNGVWQNKRDGRLFSADGGKTYYSIDEAGHPIHESVPRLPVADAAPYDR